MCWKSRVGRLEGKDSLTSETKSIMDCVGVWTCRFSKTGGTRMQELPQLVPTSLILRILRLFQLQNEESTIKQDFHSTDIHHLEGTNSRLVCLLHKSTILIAHQRLQRIPRLVHSHIRGRATSIPRTTVHSEPPNTQDGSSKDVQSHRRTSWLPSLNKTRSFLRQPRLDQRDGQIWVP